jgi:hypothetical protein
MGSYRYNPDASPGARIARGIESGAGLYQDYKKGQRQEDINDRQQKRFENDEEDRAKDLQDEDLQDQAQAEYNKTFSDDMEPDDRLNAQTNKLNEMRGATDADGKPLYDAEFINGLSEQAFADADRDKLKLHKKFVENVGTVAKGFQGIDGDEAKSKYITEQYSSLYPGENPDVTVSGDMITVGDEKPIKMDKFMSKISKLGESPEAYVTGLKDEYDTRVKRDHELQIQGAKDAKARSKENRKREQTLNDAYNKDKHALSTAYGKYKDDVRERNQSDPEANEQVEPWADWSKRENDRLAQTYGNMGLNVTTGKMTGGGGGAAAPAPAKTAAAPGDKVQVELPTSKPVVEAKTEPGIVETQGQTTKEDPWQAAAGGQGISKPTDVKTGKGAWEKMKEIPGIVKDVAQTGYEGVRSADVMAKAPVAVQAMQKSSAGQEISQGEVAIILAMAQRQDDELVSAGLNPQQIQRLRQFAEQIQSQGGASGAAQMGAAQLPDTSPSLPAR